MDHLTKLHELWKDIGNCMARAQELPQGKSRETALAYTHLQIAQMFLVAEGDRVREQYQPEGQPGVKKLEGKEGGA